MDYLEGNFYLGMKDGLNGMVISDVQEVSRSCNAKVIQALHEYRAGVILGEVMHRYEIDTILYGIEVD